uniref:Centromere protein I n=1 Tax=Sipha flava TaxID=143950 RepID=A0A2S2QW82_9HEMI
MDSDVFYDRNMFFTELSQSIDRKKLSTNVLFENYLNHFKDIVQHNGLVEEEMKIICQLFCTVELNLKTFKQVLLILVPENPNIPTDVCEELIVLVLSIYHENVNNMKKAECILYWLLYVVEEKLTNVDIIDKYYKILFHLCTYGNLNSPVAGIIYFLTKPEDVQNWMITCCKNIINIGKNESSMNKLLTFFENPNLILETRQKGLFDSKSKFVIQLANGLRSVKKELISKHLNSTSLQLTEYSKKNSDGFYSEIKFVNVNNKFELPRTKDLAKVIMDQSISNNSLSLLDNISGWCKLLMNTEAKLNIQQRFSNNLNNSLDQIINENNLTKKTKFLQEILEFQKFAHRGLVAVNLFIFKYIISWDGMQCAWILYELFEYLSFTSEEELKNRFLEKLFPIFITGDELICKIIIKSLTNLLCNLVSECFSFIVIQIAMTNILLDYISNYF